MLNTDCDGDHDDLGTSSSNKRNHNDDTEVTNTTWTSPRKRIATDRYGTTTASAAGTLGPQLQKKIVKGGGKAKTAKGQGGGVKGMKGQKKVNRCPLLITAHQSIHVRR